MSSGGFVIPTEVYSLTEGLIGLPGIQRRRSDGKLFISYMGIVNKDKKYVFRCLKRKPKKWWHRKDLYIETCDIWQTDYLEDLDIVQTKNYKIQISACDAPLFIRKDEIVPIKTGLTCQ